LLKRARSTPVSNSVFVSPENLTLADSDEQFDAVIGSGALWQAGLGELLDLILHVLKPGGQFLFFEPNLRFPARLFNEMARRRRGTGFDGSPASVVDACGQRGFTEIRLAPHDIVSCHLGFRAMRRVQAKAVLMEHMPGLRLACASMYLSGRKPGDC